MPALPSDQRLSIPQLRHDLLTNLTVVHLRTEVLMRRLPSYRALTATERTYLETGLLQIQTAAHHMTERIEQLLPEALAIRDESRGSGSTWR